MKTEPSVYNCFLHNLYSSSLCVLLTWESFWNYFLLCVCWPAVLCIWGHPDWPSILWGADTVPPVLPRSWPRSKTLRCPEGLAACQSPGSAKLDSTAYRHVHMRISSKSMLTSDIIIADQHDHLFMYLGHDQTFITGQQWFWKSARFQRKYIYTRAIFYVKTIKAGVFFMSLLRSLDLSMKAERHGASDKFNTMMWPLPIME